MAAGADRPPQPGIDRLDGICRADDGPDFPVEPQEGHEFRPGVLPEPDDSRVALLPFAAEFGELVQRLGFGCRGVNGLEVFRDLRPVPLRGVLEGIPQEMHDTCLHDRLLPDRTHRIGQPLEPVADQHAHVGDAAVLDLGQDPQPELGALAVAVLAGPQPQDVALAVHGDAQRQVDGAVGDLALADLHADRVDEDHRVYRLVSSGRCESGTRRFSCRDSLRTRCPPLLSGSTSS